MTQRILAKQPRKSKPSRPDKPSPDFPLTAHAVGKWCKKVRGRIYYFGSWDDPLGALNEWLEVRDDLMAGRDPKDRQGGHDIDWLVNAFLDSREQKQLLGDLSQVALNDYVRVCKQIANFFGKGRLLDTIDSSDFKRLRESFPKTWNSTTVNNAITRVSTVFTFAYEVGAVDHPIRKGPNFKRVSRKRQRLERSARNSKLFEAAEIHRVLEAADVQMKAMILLGINCGFGNADCGRLEVSMIDFDRQWIEGLRPKTAIQRAAWLWPETISAVLQAIQERYPHAPASLADRVFITKRRQPWYLESGKSDAISAAFRKLRTKTLVAEEIKHLVEHDGKDPETAHELAESRWCHVGFYSMRHVFETIAGNSKDQIAVNYVMGHADQSMAAVYQEGIDPQRIIDVCSFVRQWWIEGKPKVKSGNTAKGQPS